MVEELQVLNPVQFGCTDFNYFEYNPLANLDDGTCLVLASYGCIDPVADNYNPDANINQVSFEDTSDPCYYFGCTDSEFLEYWQYDPINSSISDPIIEANFEEPTSMKSESLEIIFYLLYLVLVHGRKSFLEFFMHINAQFQI